MKKRLLALLLVCALAAGLASSPASASGSSLGSTAHAECLVALHLFQGTESGYQLDRTPTRLQGLIMLIRLLGVEELALSCTEENPFSDVTGTGDRYAAYAYANGLTKGTGADTFTPARALTPANYVTFLLRALGYRDGADFAVGQSLDFAASISMMTADAAASLRSVTMNRGDMVDLSYAALTCRMNGGDRTLAEKLLNDGVFTAVEGQAAGVLGSARWVYTYAPEERPASSGAAQNPVQPPAQSASGVTYAERTVSISNGSMAVKVLTVDPKDPKVTVKTAMVDNTLGHTAPFSQIVQNSGALAVVNGNFFASYSDFKVPIGHVMVDGRFLYGNSGLSSLGITRDGEIRVGRPALFTRIKAANTSWTAYEINTASTEGSVLYTPAYGTSLTLRSAGSVMTVSGGTVTDYRAVPAGVIVPIPADGYVVYMDGAFTATDYFRTPEVGSGVSVEYYLHQEDPEGFTLDNLVSVVSGAPRLVQDGAVVTTLEPGFTEARFTTNASPRTAVGVNGQGKLLLVSVPSATIQQMREIMLALGCVDAFNLDGGASCGMYYDGAYPATPGRELTVTLQVFAEK